MLHEFLSTLKRNRLAFLLNVLGLSVAFTVLTVVAFQAVYEFGYDRSYKDTDRIYRLNNYLPDFGDYFGLCSPLAEVITESFPEIEASALIAYYGPNRLTLTDAQGNLRNFDENYCEVTPGFLEVFSPRIISGDPETCWESVNSVALPESIAYRLFGKESPLGKSLVINGKEVIVSLVYGDFPKNSTIRNAVLSPVTEFVWSNWPYSFYMKFASGSRPEEIVGKIAALDFPQEVKDHGITPDRFRYSIQPVKDLYFKGVGKGNNEKGNFNATLSLIAVAVLIIMIAFVNFINFSTALAPVRIRRVNIQKVLGSTRGRLIRFITFESGMISLFAFGISLLWTIVFISSPLTAFFNADLVLRDHIGLLSGIGIAALLLGLAAGLYPAFYMTSFPPALVLKGSFALSPKSVRLRNSLVVFQFICTVVLITVASFIKIQHDFMQNMDTGFERENVLYIHLTEGMKQQINAFTQDLEAKPEITGHTLAAYLPGNVDNRWGRDIDGKPVNFTIWAVGHNFLRFFNIKVVEGTGFGTHPEKGNDKIIFNRKLVEKYNLKDLLGKEIASDGGQKGIIVGIAEDVNFSSLREEIEPMAFVCGEHLIKNYILLKVSGIRLPETIDYIRKVGKQYSGEDFQLGFLDQYTAHLYQREENFARLISVFGGITILISLMGIYGLILFNARFRTKEIGIRKVNGATELQMIVLLNKDFLRLILFSFVIAVPVAWYVVREWLSEFAYRTPVYWWVFLLAGAATVLITILTVSYQSWKAASVNPIGTLGGE